MGSFIFGYLGYYKLDQTLKPRIDFILQNSKQFPPKSFLKTPCNLIVKIIAWIEILHNFLLKYRDLSILMYGDSLEFYITLQLSNS